MFADYVRDRITDGARRGMRTAIIVDEKGETVIVPTPLRTLAQARLDRVFMMLDTNGKGVP